MQTLMQTSPDMSNLRNGKKKPTHTPENKKDN